MAQEFRKFVTHLKLEALALAILMVVLTSASPYSLWVLPLSFLVFDLGMIGYLFNDKIGSIGYNFSHNFTVPTLLVAYGVATGNNPVAVIGYCWIFHISVDRTLGYGLKHRHSFHDTHLGKIGNKNA